MKEDNESILSKIFFSIAVVMFIFYWAVGILYVSGILRPEPKKIQITCEDGEVVNLRAYTDIEWTCK